MLTLRQLTKEDKSAFLQGLQAFSGESPHWYSFIWWDILDYTKMLETLKKEHLGLDLAPGRVAHTMLYAFVDEVIVGRLSLRHCLNDFLKLRGGHLGYAIAPPYRCKGYAKEIMRLGLKICSAQNINPILITCSEANIPSIKIIEHFGGILENTIKDLESEEKVRRYWIKL